MGYILAKIGGHMGYDDFKKELKQNRIIVIDGYIGGGLAHQVVLDLLQYAADDDREQIQLFISAYDGEYLDVMAIYDTIRSLKNPVICVCCGAASGFATMLVSACEKGSRYALRHTEIRLSQPSGYMGAGANQQTEVAILAKETRIEREVMEKVLARCTGKPIEVIHADCERDLRLSAEEAVAYGIIDAIYE